MESRLLRAALGLLTASPTLVLAALALLLALYLYRLAYERPPNFPPGPPRLPLWGSYWIILRNNYAYIHKALWREAQRYKTTIMGFFLGPFKCVLLTEYGDIRELYNRFEFAGRPDVILARERDVQGARNGIIFSEGPAWLHLRRFTQREMREFGFGRRFEPSEAVMAQEMRDLMDLLRGDWRDEAVCKDGKVLTSQLFYPYAINAMWSMFGGERLPRGQHALLRRMARDQVLFFHNAEISGGAVSMTPWLRYLWPGRFGLDNVVKYNQKAQDFVRKAIDEHKATYHEDHMRDFMDKFLKEMKKFEGHEKSDTFNDEQLLLTGMDFIVAASGALSSMAGFLCLHLLHYPEVQRRVQAEVDNIVGRDRQPTLDDRQRMPYSEATIRETLRRTSLSPLSLPHTALEDTTFRDYDIPKGTVMYPCIYALHMNSKLYEDPWGYRPEHFLDKDGNLKKKDLTLPFGLGRRVCSGETFARHMLFLFLTHTMQSFTILPVGKLPKLGATVNGFAQTPVALWAQFEPRD